LRNPRSVKNEGFKKRRGIEKGGDDFFRVSRGKKTEEAKAQESNCPCPELTVREAKRGTAFWKGKTAEA
jgi:hypothetical protein